VLLASMCLRVASDLHFTLAPGCSKKSPDLHVPIDHEGDLDAVMRDVIEPSVAES
jgi:hypothetical protein